MRIQGVVVIVAAAGLLSGASLPVRAQCAGFVDVSGGDPACAAVTWIKNRAITIGCPIANSYCPSAPVGRLTMALFMHRLGKLLTPAPVAAEQTGNALDLSSEAFVCQTVVVPAVAYQRTFLGDAGLSFVANAPGSLIIGIAQSINGGVFSGFTGVFHVSFQAGTLVNVGGISQNAIVAANSSYRYAVRVLGSNFTSAALTSWTCNLQSEIVNFNS